MKFHVASYIDGLRRALDALPPQSRTAFAVWCAIALLQEVRKYLAAKSGANADRTVQEAMDYLWSCASGDVEASESDVSRLQRACAEIGWSEADIADDEQATDIYAIEAVSCLMNALDTCRTGSALSAAKSAECMINTLDRQLSEDHGRSSTDAVFSDARMRAELERQERMLTYLQSHRALTKGQKLIFRE
jgi:hypothetical protein